MKKKEIKFLEDKQLQSLPTKRLLSILKSARAVKCSIIKRHICECCDSFIDSTKEAYEKDVAPFKKYYEKIKEILSKREHIQRKQYA